MKREHRSGRAGVATLADVGRVAGVSKMAASLVLNRPDAGSRISPETRRRILSAAESLGYRPNVVARALTSGRMHSIGIVAVLEDGHLDRYFLEVFSGLLAAAARCEQNTTIFNLRDWQEGFARLARLLNGRIDGLILLAPTLDRTVARLAAGLPAVTIHANRAVPGVANVESDEEEGAFQLVQHLIARGHRRIVHLAGPEGLLGSERRARGWKRALAAAGIPLERELLMHAGYTSELGRMAMRRWLVQHAGEPPPDAVFCANDASALGCFDALTEAGLRVPDDVSIAGFDDLSLAHTDAPPLTTVRQPLREMGSRAVELLLEGIGAPGSTSAGLEVFPVELVPRSSVRARLGAAIASGG
jgi:LacI family transcriptional regulator